MAEKKKPAKKEEPKKEKKAAPKKEEKKAKPAPKKEAPKKEAPKKAAKKEEKPEKKEKNNNAYHISKREKDGMWQVFRAGSDKVIKLFKTKAEAEEYVKKMAENQGVTYHSHASKGKNKGKIQKK